MENFFKMFGRKDDLQVERQESADDLSPAFRARVEKGFEHRPYDFNSEAVMEVARRIRQEFPGVPLEDLGEPDLNKIVESVIMSKDIKDEIESMPQS